VIDPRLAPLLAEALSLGMDVSLKLSDGEYDVFWDGLGRICATQEEVCAWLDTEIGDYCRSRGLVRNMPSFADLVTSPYRTAADQERLLSFQEEVARISKHTKPAGNSEEG